MSKTKTKILLPALALVTFTAYTLVVVARHGLLGFLDDHALGGWHLQIFIDLVIALIGFYVVAIPESKRLGISAWPYALATPFLGSIAMLAYLVRRQLAVARRG